MDGDVGHAFLRAAEPDAAEVARGSGITKEAWFCTQGVGMKASIRAGSPGAGARTSGRSTCRVVSGMARFLR
jgi:hypothetical protein